MSHLEAYCGVPGLKESEWTVAYADFLFAALGLELRPYTLS
jgi:hypothetical protein